MRRGLAALGLVAAVAPAAAQTSATAPGFVLDPAGGDSTRELDERGLSHLRDVRRRTPTGFLYPVPLVPQELGELDRGWLGRASLEIGGIATFGDDDEARFSKYADWSRNFLLDSFSAGVLHPESDFYAEVEAGGVARDDDWYSGELGRLGLVRLRGSWSGIPYTSATDARQLFLGAGTSDLRLPDTDPPLVPGGPNDRPPALGQPSPIEAALASVGESTLRVQRDELGLDLDLRLLPELRLFGHYGRQRRDGERPFGGSLVYATGFGPARAVETTLPVDDRTHEVTAGVELERGPVMGRLAYNGSFYRNDRSSLSWDNPFQVGPPVFGAPNVQRSRFALDPDNDWHNARGQLAVRLPWDGRLSSVLSWSRMRQDQELLPPTLNSGVVGAGATAVDLDLWNSDAALEQSSADAEATTWLATADLRLRPWRPLRLGARVRWFERDNDTHYRAFNPATGQIGYIGEDGALEAGQPLVNRIFRPGEASDDWRYRSTPYGWDQLLAEGSADWALRDRTALGLRYAFERRGYDHRERERTAEHRVRAELASRELAWATARLSYEFGDRGGSSYDPDPYRNYFVSSLPGFTSFVPGVLPPYTLAQLRKADLADRAEHLANLRVNLLLREDMDVSAAFTWRDDRYDADYGLDYDRRGSAALEWSLQPSPEWDVFVFGTFELGRRRISNINDAPAASSDPNAGGPVYPFDRSWSLRTEATSGGVGAGLRRRFFGRFTVESVYTFLISRQRLDYDFASAGALTPLLTAAQAGSRFPTLVTEDHALQTSLRVELREGVALRVFHLFQHGEIADFQQDGLAAGLVAGSSFLGHEDRDYDAQVLGATVELRF